MFDGMTVEQRLDPGAFSYEQKQFFVQLLMTDLMDRTGLAADGWSYRENVVAKRFLGSCLYGDRRLEVSREAIKRNSIDALFNTGTHEVAHAIAGFEAGHNSEWQRIHRSLGGNGERCGTYESGRPGRYEAVSDCGASCGWRWRMGAAMRQGRSYHADCGPECRITWVDHEA